MQRQIHWLMIKFQKILCSQQNFIISIIQYYLAFSVNMEVNKKDSFMIKSRWFQMKVLQHNFDGRHFRHPNHTRDSAGSRKYVN